MSWASVSSAILPLAGIVIGASGTLLGQRQAMRVDARREAARRSLDQRAERKEAIIGFLGATERVEQHRGQLATESTHGATDLIELMHAVWLTKKIIELVCPGILAQAAGLHLRAQPDGPRSSLRAEFMEGLRAREPASRHDRRSSAARDLDVSVSSSAHVVARANSRQARSRRRRL